MGDFNDNQEESLNGVNTNKSASVIKRVFGAMKSVYVALKALITFIITHWQIFLIIFAVFLFVFIIVITISLIFTAALSGIYSNGVYTPSAGTSYLWSLDIK